MVRFRGALVLRGLVLLGTACALAGCGESEDAGEARTACQAEVRGHLQDAGAKKVSFGESEVDDEVEEIWIVSGPVKIAGGSGDYECRVVPSELDEKHGKRIADVKIAPHLLRGS